jgi:AmmeMemoRadiSam system protein B
LTGRVRHPAVAGRFYPADPERLRVEVETYLNWTGPKTPALGAVVPHAGYMYSGRVAGALFSRIEVPQSVILLCPNHTGRGAPLAIHSTGSWQTPLGEVAVDSDLAASLQQRFPLLTDDTEAHRTEHAAEVELPFLKVLRPDVKFVPIAIAANPWEVLEELGRAMAAVIGAGGGDVLIIASSDMNHYENDAITRSKDHAAIAKVLALDARGLYDVVLREQITMCGLGPTVAMLTAVKVLGAKSAALARYATSGDVSGDREQVVGYAGILVE